MSLFKKNKVCCELNEEEKNNSLSSSEINTNTPSVSRPRVTLDRTVFSLVTHQTKYSALSSAVKGLRVTWSETKT